MTDAQLAPAARRDLLHASRWIAKDNPAAAEALRGSVGKVATLLDELPYVGNLRLVVADASFRFFSLTGFSYIVVYDPETRPRLILRMLHEARDLPVVLRGL